MGAHGEGHPKCAFVLPIFSQDGSHCQKIWAVQLLVLKGKSFTEINLDVPISASLRGFLRGPSGSVGYMLDGSFIFPQRYFFNSLFLPGNPALITAFDKMALHAECCSHCSCFLCVQTETVDSCFIKQWQAWENQLASRVTNSNHDHYHLPSSYYVPDTAPAPHVHCLTLS